jgi:hypothetical protein
MYRVVGCDKGGRLFIKDLFLPNLSRDEPGFESGPRSPYTITPYVTYTYCSIRAFACYSVLRLSKERGTSRSLELGSVTSELRPCTPHAIVTAQGLAPSHLRKVTCLLG